MTVAIANARVAIVRAVAVVVAAEVVAAGSN